MIPQDEPRSCLVKGATMNQNSWQILATAVFLLSLRWNSGKAAFANPEPAPGRANWLNCPGDFNQKIEF
jgi:hypothetical protein